MFGRLGQWFHDRARDAAYKRGTAKIRHRLLEIETATVLEEKTLGRKIGKVKTSDLSPFFQEYDRDLVLPDDWVCAPVKPFAWAFDVQGFLMRKGRWIRTWVDPETGESPAASISKAAHEFGVNPRLLVASLQREKGLIRRSTPAPKKDLDWAAGVGAYDKGPWDEKYKGFAQQVRSMAVTYRNRFSEYEKDKPMTVNPWSSKRRKAYLKNAATWALLQYTPHDDGTLLTWKIMRFFFGT